MYHRYYEIPTSGSLYIPRLAKSTNARTTGQKISINGTSCIIQLAPEQPDDLPLFEGIEQMALEQAQALSISQKYLMPQP